MNFRSLIDWIAGRKAPKAATQTAVSSERRRFSRLPLSEGEAHVIGCEPIAVINLSFGGMRLALPENCTIEDWPIGRTFAATIVLGSIQFETHLRICNVRGRELGCSFQGISLGVARMISDYLKPRLLGASLREIKSAQPRNIGPDLRLRWFQGDNGTEVYLWEHLDGGLVKEELYFLDYCVSWEESGDCLRTARVTEGSGRQGYGRIDQSSLFFFRVPSYRALRMGQVILVSSSLPADARDRFLARMAREERRLYSRYLVSANETRLSLSLAIFPDTPLSVINLSLHGIAFLHPEACPNPFTRQASEGILRIAEQEIAITFRPAFSHGNVIGGALHFQHPADSEAVAAYLAPRLLGQSLEEHPAVLEELPTCPKGCAASLYIGVHNTHVLSVITDAGSLHLGRLAFMDRILIVEKQTINLYSCSRGIVFPRDWDLPSGQIEPLTCIDAEFFEVCRQMLASSPLPEKVIAAWQAALTLLPTQTSS